ncbi:MAG TPA: CaiB/BaiF CoA-transferase family protein [Pseudonocardia sp.]|uniref:CaiB/BaiF CoA transferase family protein n=1 Tax=Pseudonocardia sp. TaxID=60912 RepID=UPI002CD8A2CC|nr:CaiB/BaiF CoA-transferase family protein [Pseudonocardia sp.]HTF53193.1 CaiB/BaiF CoA-transferase family protein [Pseudonocardia sp.]
MGPLTGIRVVDFSRVLAGPHCAQNLLDLGAEVIKIEPPSGDISRRAFPRQGEISGYYAQQNAGKRNISIDLNVDGAREIALRLCDEADIVVENFRPGTLAGFGLGYDDVVARNPGVVYASISGYGQHGAWRARSAYAPTVQAETGITKLSNVHFGTPEDHPRTDSLSHADIYAGLHATIAILAALNERRDTGRGQYIDVAMAAVMLSINERVHVDLSDAELGDETPILGATDCAFFIGPDGKRFVSPISLVGSMSFPFYLAAMRRPDLARDPRFATPEDRRRNLEALHEIVQRWIWTFDDLASLDAQLDEAKIAMGAIRGISELAESDWATQWGATRTVPDGAGGRITVPGRPWHFTGAAKPNETAGATETVPEPDRQSARQGEHNEEVLRELGYDDDQITKLTNTGVLVHTRDTN